jgi:hypothetical protein
MCRHREKDMRRNGLRAIARSGLLIALGAVTLSTPLAQASVTATLPTCINETPELARIGLHLHLLAPAANCPQGAYGPGAHFATIATATFALSLSTLLVGLLGLLVAVGTTVWARRIVRQAHTWIRARLALLPDIAIVPILPERQPVLRPVPIHDPPYAGRSRLRRGPPRTSC